MSALNNARTDPLGARADALSALQNLGRPLSRLPAEVAPIPWESPIPGALDLSHDTRPTRTKKCCKDNPQPERFSSEWYPIEAPKDMRVKVAVFGAPSRFDGRDPVAYRR